MTDNLVERLREVGGMSDDGATRWYINPDGPEAADRIEKLEAALDEAAFSQTLFDAVVGQRNKATDRIEKLEAENKKFKCGLWSVINLCKWGVDRTPSFCSEPEGFCQCIKAFDALDYDLSNMYPMD